MAIITTDLDFDTACASLQDLTGRPRALTTVEFCSLMTWKLGVLAGGVRHELPEAIPFELPPYLVG